jgi:DNA-binding transcriptional LysR family regulator
MERPDLNDLIMFASVVRRSSFKGAAEHLSIPRSTISRRIAALEAQLGARLLHRTPRKVSVTEFGGKVLKHAMLLSDEMDALVDLLETRESEPSGTLRLSVPSDFTSDMLGGLLTRFIADYPKIALSVQTSLGRYEIDAEDFDVAIVTGDFKRAAHLTARRVGTIEIGLYASPSYLQKQGTPAEPSHLRSHTVLELEPGCKAAGQKLYSEQGDWEGSFEGRVTANSATVLMQLALAGAGIAPLAGHLALPRVKAGTLVRTLAEWHYAHIPVWAVFPSQGTLPMRTRIFIEAFKEQLLLYRRLAKSYSKVGQPFESDPLLITDTHSR